MENYPYSQDRLGEMSRDVTHFAFPNHPEKQEDHYNNVTNLGGMLVLVLKTDPRQRQNRENFLRWVRMLKT